MSADMGADAQKIRHRGSANAQHLCLPVAERGALQIARCGIV
jgi:hypothetical protein